jgi:hypothetical protein
MLPSPPQDQNRLLIIVKTLPDIVTFARTDPGFLGEVKLNGVIPMHTG